MITSRYIMNFGILLLIAFALSGCKASNFQSSETGTSKQDTTTSSRDKESDQIADNSPSTRPSEDPSELPGYGLTCKYLFSDIYNCSLAAGEQKPKKVDLSPCNAKWSTGNDEARLSILPDNRDSHVAIEGDSSTSLTVDPGADCKNLKKTGSVIKDVLTNPEAVPPPSPVGQNATMTEIDFSSTQSGTIAEASGPTECISLEREALLTFVQTTACNQAEATLTLTPLPDGSMDQAVSISTADDRCLSFSNEFLGSDLDHAGCSTSQNQKFRFIFLGEKDTYSIISNNNLCMSRKQISLLGTNWFSFENCDPEKTEQRFVLTVSQ